MCRSAEYGNIIAVTNRHLCADSFLEQIERICMRHPLALLLREKDLSREAYEDLLMQVLQICDRYEVTCIPHMYPAAARRLKSHVIHLPLYMLQSHPEVIKMFEKTGVSVHSAEEARLAERLGAGYLTAGHIFHTACKPGLEPRGTDFLKEVCQAVRIPVYAIGGMKGTAECVADMMALGASGICVMSECMGW